MSAGCYELASPLRTLADNITYCERAVFSTEGLGGIAGIVNVNHEK